MVRVTTNTKTGAFTRYLDSVYHTTNKSTTYRLNEAGHTPTISAISEVLGKEVWMRDERNSSHALSGSSSARGFSNSTIRSTEENHRLEFIEGSPMSDPTGNGFPGWKHVTLYLFRAHKDMTYREIID